MYFVHNYLIVLYIWVQSKANAAFELQLKEIERQAKKEKERADGLEKDLQHLKVGEVLACC